MREPIDIVITWVDGNDPAWLEEKSRFERGDGGPEPLAADESRYRDWDNIRYIFRGIERFMPWVHRIHFVTWGHIPAWLNTLHPKLHIVRHEEFIPEAYLPTFNSNVIEMNCHRIPGLAEQFILFNDDMFVIGPVKPSDFFLNGLPRDMAVISPPRMMRDPICGIETNNLGIINDYFSVDDIRKNRKKWYSPKYGKYLIRTMLFGRFRTIIGIFEPHIPLSFRKESFEEVWRKEEEEMDRMSRNRFRSRGDYNIWLVRQWQLMSGKFEPRREDFGRFMRPASQEKEIIRRLKHPGNMKLLCINDSPDLRDFEKCKKHINRALDELLHEKSSFEQ